MRVKKYDMFLESSHNEREKIINKIIPFINEKYDALSNWAKKKINTDTQPISKLVFEKKDGAWELTMVISGWVYNKGNKLIKYVLSKYIKEIFEKYKINFSSDTYASIYSITDKESIEEYIIFDNVTKKEID